jgi:catechol 2,3-dioxygenase-like lactoylglutathione lyase family enzyme
METALIDIVPVLPSSDINRDTRWYRDKTGFELVSKNDMYAILRMDKLSIHLQWHAGTQDDPLLGGSVIRIFVKNIKPLFEAFVERGTVKKDKLRLQTQWGTNEFGFYDLNNNAIFFVEDI